jgi:alpha-D-ribose 1-methylphosphonate 5-triphosphate synthase subunit PhnH
VWPKKMMPDIEVRQSLALFVFHTKCPVLSPKQRPNFAVTSSIYPLTATALQPFNSLSLFMLTFAVLFLSPPHIF